MPKPDRPLEGSVAIVTGASRGLGRAFAIDLAANGASVTAVARNEHDLRQTGELIAVHQVPFELLVGDVNRDEFAEEAIAHTRATLGPVDLLVNNAGTAYIAAVAEMSIDAWWNDITTNLRAPVVWTRAALDDLLRRPGTRIINISSPAMFSPLPYISAYGASKAGLSQFTACFAPEVAPAGLVVIAFGPLALTDMTRSTFNNDVIPQADQDAYRQAFTTSADEMLAASLQLFRAITTGAADHLTGTYVGLQRTGFDTPGDLAARPVSAAGAVLPTTPPATR